MEMIKKYNMDASLVNYIDNLGMGVEARGSLGGSVYYVEGNAGKDNKSGTSIDGALQTLTAACAISHADIGRRARWAKRNTIYCFGDTFTENLVAFPQKTDIVGLGSYNANKSAGLIGNHAPVNAGIGTRIFNMWLKGPAVASPLVALTAACGGAEFIGCTFDAAAQTTIAIQATASPYLKVRACRFQGAFATSYIALLAGEAGATVIRDNIMGDSAGTGITMLSTTTSSWRSMIKDNFIQSAGQCIDDESDLFYIVGNTLVTAATVAFGGAAAIDANAARSVGNQATGGTGVHVWFPSITLS
jgi:hypothetical protein